MNYSHLAELLGKLEIISFGENELKWKTNPFSGLANGEFQGFSIEDTPIKVPKPLLVVGVGINYGQGKPAKWLTPHLLGRKGRLPPVVPLDRDWVEDLNLATGKPYDKAMRNATNAALDNYFGNETEWKANRYASNETIGTQLKQFKGKPYPYALIAANFSPFLTEKTWASHSKHKLRSRLVQDGPLDQLHFLLTAPCFQGHLNCDSSESDFTVEDAIWIFHGKDAVWPLFDDWIKTHPIKNWLLTWNLNQRSANMKFSGFWKKERPKL